jgi:small GTP-binding protein
MDEIQLNNYILVKCILIGNSGVGKTSIIERYIKDLFNSSPTIGVEFYCKKIQIEKVLFKLHVWDLAGQITYRNIVQNYYTNTAIIFYVFNRIDVISFYDFEDWIRGIRHIENKMIVFINNKSDLGNGGVSDTEILELVNRYKGIYYETSAKDNVNIREVFETTLKILHDRLVLKDRNIHIPRIAKMVDMPEGVKFCSVEEQVVTQPVVEKGCC